MKPFQSKDDPSQSLAYESPQQVRAAIRAGTFGRKITSGAAPGYVQTNLAIMPKSWAFDFLKFCHFNPKPCPLLGMTEIGDPHLPALGKDIDLRTDLPLYRVWRDGDLVEQVTDISALWNDELVGFALGCSFSFEQALLEAGLPLRNVEQRTDNAVFRTDIPCQPAGRLRGPVVVSMRPLKPADAIRAIQICTRFPDVHGAPIHFGDPAAIGIADIDKPDYGDRVPVLEGEVPVFWACGVTPQAVLRESKVPFCITHSPGSMLVTDVLNNSLSLF